MTTALIYLLPFLSGLLLAIGVLWMKRPFFTLAKRSVSLLNTLVSDLDEDEKFEAVNAQVFKTMGALALVLCMSIVVICFSTAVYTGVFGLVFEKTLSSGIKMGILAVGSIVPFVIPRKQTSDYSDIAQLFHRLVLDNYHLGKRLLERQIKNSEVSSHYSGPFSRVLITGLARSGTTALTKELEKRGPFASLDYSNMPVLLAPRLWRKFYRPKQVENKERAHGDGVKVGLASVEALEEYFFKVLKQDCYILETGLQKHALSEEENALYRKYQNSISEPGKVYLAKNNNAITRLPSLIKHNPDLIVFVMLRDPLQHAYSLMKQHQKFLAKQEKDPFVIDYMNWLGHHEFGSNQRPFLLQESEAELHLGDPNTIAYWLKRWVSYYTYVQEFETVHLLSYEAYAHDPVATLHCIAQASFIDLDTTGLAVFSKKDVPMDKAGSTLETAAHELYLKLIGQCRNVSL